MSISLEDLRRMGDQLSGLLGLTGSAVGLRFLPIGAANPDGVTVLQQYRYCQALMRARHGAAVLLDGHGIACSAAAFGFRPLPDGLRFGKGLIGFGIAMDEAVGRRMFETMPHLKPNSIQSLHLFPTEFRLLWLSGCYRYRLQRNSTWFSGRLTAGDLSACGISGDQGAARLPRQGGMRRAAEPNANRVISIG